MKKVLARPPSASMVVAVAALVMAVSGSAVAASGLVSGNSLIKKHSLSGNRLKNHTITGKQIKMSKLGTVPKANVANFATTAGSATTATSAANAGRAQSSATTDNIKTWFANASQGQTVTLLTVGPFTYTGVCSTVSGNPHAQTFVATSQNGSVADSYADYIAYPNSDSDIAFGPGSGPLSVGYGSDEDINQTTAGTHWVGPYDGSDTQMSGDGHTYVNTFAAVGTDVGGSDCVFAGHAIVVTR